MSRIVAMIGYRGTGKTTVGRQLAQRLDWDFCDTDALIQTRAGRTITEIFHEEGESAFRAMESEVIDELAREFTGVLSLGGGAVLRSSNVDALRPNCRFVWLQARPASILARIAADQSSADQRPNLTTAGGVVEIEQLLAQRTPLYRQVADLICDTDQHDRDAIVEWICQRLGLA